MPRARLSMSLFDRPIPLRILIVLAAAQIALGWMSAARDACTSDETAHITAGYVQLRTGQAHLDPEAGPLVKWSAALPLLALRLDLPATDSPDFLGGEVWRYGSRFMHQRQDAPVDGPPTANDTDTILRWARLPNLLLLGLLSILIYRVAFEWFGARAAAAALLLALTCPNLLAHGRYATADLPVTLGFFAFVWAWTRLLERITAANVALAAAAAATLVLAKFSWVLVLPAALAVAVLRFAGAGARDRGASSAHEAARPPRAAPFLACAAIIAVAAFAAIWASCGFRYEASTPLASSAARPSFLMPYGRTSASPDEAWRDVLAPNDAPARIVGFARDHRVLPESYLYGFMFTLRMSEKRGAFLDGRVSNTGFRSYFPLAFLYKTPLATIAALLLGAIALARTRSLWSHPGMRAMLLFAATYALTSLASRLNIGHRHILPLYPVMYLIAAAPFARVRDGVTAQAARDDSARAATPTPRARRIATASAIAIVIAALSGVFAWRDPLAYFNSIAGGRAGGYRHLIDSNVDWGHDLKRVGEYFREHPAPRFTIDYEGSASPAYYGIAADNLMQLFLEGRTPEPGAFAVSVTRLSGIFAPTLTFLPSGPQWTDAHEDARRAAVETTAALDSLRAGLVTREGLTARDPGWSPYFAADGSIEPGAATRVTQARDALAYLRFLDRLRERAPDARVGASYFIYDLDAAEIEAMLRLAETSHSQRM
ncbi:MAG: glycosyltransferase family 39 protein [bacterium]